MPLSSTPIAPGERVVWTSQSGGSEVTKYGTVVAFVSAGQPAHTMMGDATPSDLRRVSDVSTRDRYLVRVDRIDRSRAYRSESEPKVLHRARYYAPVATQVLRDITAADGAGR